MKITQYLQIGRCLKVFRIMKGVSQKEMADRMKLPAATYSNYENGYSNPTIEIIQEFCTIVRISLDDFFRYAVDHADKAQEERG